MADIDYLKEKFLSDISQASDLEQLNEIKIAALGKKGAISEELSKLGKMAADARREAGRIINSVKQDLNYVLTERHATLAKQALEKKLETEKIDVSLPSRPSVHAKIHPLSRTMEEISAIFSDMGFVIAEGPEIETDEHNFTALNIPPEHPARQEHDTFYLKPDESGERPVLRTHTSPVQIRTMRSKEPPIRIIVPGRTYRSDHDATHSPMFHQCEGLVIGPNIHMGHLKATLIDFCRSFFGVVELPVRFRPSYFPFTEPSAEVDLSLIHISEPTRPY